MMKNMILSRFFGAALAIIIAAPVVAQDDLCGVEMHDALMERMVGNWTTTVLSATLTSPGLPAYPLVGANPVFPTSFSVIGGELAISMTAQGGQVNIPLMAAQRQWDLSADDTTTGPAMTDADLSTLLDCDVNYVPRLSGEAPFRQGGISSQASLYLYVLNEDQLYGMLHIVSTDFHLRESVSIAR